VRVSSVFRRGVHVSDDAHIAQTLADDVLAVATKLGFACPPLALGAAVVKTLVDAGFAAYFRSAAVVLNAQVAAQSAGIAAAESQAATTAMERERRKAAESGGGHGAGTLKTICRPCADVFAEMIDGGGVP